MPQQQQHPPPSSDPERSNEEEGAWTTVTTKGREASRNNNRPKISASNKKNEATVQILKRRTNAPPAAAASGSGKVNQPKTFLNKKKNIQNGTTKTTTAAAIPSPPRKKQKKPKPQQTRSMNLGDLVGDVLPRSSPQSKKGTRSNAPKQSKSTTTSSRPAPAVPKTRTSAPSFDDDFPALTQAASNNTSASHPTTTNAATSMAAATAVMHRPPQSTNKDNLGASINQHKKPAPQLNKATIPQGRKKETKTQPSRSKPTVTAMSSLPLRHNSSTTIGKAKDKKKKDHKTTMSPPKKTNIITGSVNNSKSAPSHPHAAAFLLPPTQQQDGVVSTTGGSEHDLLLRFVQQQGKIGSSSSKKNNDVVVVQKGRQRIHPRKKKFTTLKKRVLQERLQKWRELHPDEEQQNGTTNTANVAKDVAATATPSPSSLCTTVCLEGFVQPEELQDDDEYEEILSNLQSMANKIGSVVDVFLPRGEKEEGDITIMSKTKCPAFVWFVRPHDAAAACACWDGLVIGGERLEATLMIPDDCDGCPEPQDNDDNDEESRRKEEAIDQWRRSVLTYRKTDDGEQPQTTTLSDQNSTGVAAAGAVDLLHHPDTSLWIVELRNVLTDDDFEDEDCLEESIEDIRILAGRYGSISDVQAKKEDAVVLVTYMGLEAAKNAVEQFSSMVLGGLNLSARVLNTVDSIDDAKEEDAATKRNCVVLLRNILTEDDIEDEECLEETKSDLAELAGHFGPVVSVHVELESRLVKIQYEGCHDICASAAKKFDGMIIGGQEISASVLADINASCRTETSAMQIAETQKTSMKDAPEATSPMFSGERVIPERFAQCKRVPKIPNPPGPRHYAAITNDDRVKPLLTEMLGELMRLQRRAVEDKNAKARRRIVMGLREVARGIRAHKVKMVVMANNLDEYGAIDEKLQAILDLAHDEEVPIFFEFSKRALGKAVGKSIKVAVVGIQSAEGAHQQFKKLSSLAVLPQSPTV